MPLTPGVHLIHKPVGVTSLVALRRFVGPRGPRVCHGGALDPFAEGLLLVLAGEATKLFPYLHDVPKVYEAEVAWGVETDNGDPGGIPVATGGPRPSAGVLDATLRRFLGWTEQVPPATSNKRIDGERAYTRAHRGERVELPPSRVYLHAAAWSSHPGPRRSVLRLSCRGGFYVRALVRDVGRAAGCPAHLSSLRRSAIGPWACPPAGASVALVGEDLLPWCPRVRLGPAELAQLSATGWLRSPARAAPWPLPAGFGPPPALALCERRVVAVLRAEGDTWRAELLLRGSV